MPGRYYNSKRVTASKTLGGASEALDIGTGTGSESRWFTKAERKK